MAQLAPLGRYTILAAALIVPGCRSSRTPPSAASAASEYAPAGRCRACHAQIAKSYHSVAMARSVYRPAEANVIEDYSTRNQFFHAPSNRHYRMLRRDGRFFQRRFQLDAQGKEMNALEQEVTHIIGSGEHARSYLHLSSSGKLRQLPVTWYTQERRWGMSPGFDKARHYDFGREIDHGCLFCHNAYPSLPAGEGRYGMLPRFPEQLPEGIDCQRCHGPGARHIELASSKSELEKVRSAIVNPKNLPWERQMDVCLQCHLETSSARLPGKLRRFSRDVYSFRPGERLSDYVLDFDHPPGTGFDDKFEINSAGYRLGRSPCFRASQGRLTCTTCHNPHQILRGEAAAGEYRKQCRGCHPNAHPERPESNCVPCHMPKRRAEDAVHVVMTDHRIQRKPGSRDLLAPRAESETVWRGGLVFYEAPEMQEAERDLYLGMAQVVNQADRARGIALLERQASGAPAEALVELATAHLAAGDARTAILRFRSALEKRPGMPAVRYNYARALETAGDSSQAAAEYQRVVAEAPNFGEALNSYGSFLLKQGQRGLARQMFERAIQADPALPEPHNNLGLLLAAEGRPDEARARLAEALSAEPGFAEAHNSMAKVLAEQGKINDALTHLRQAIALNPAYGEARYNFGRLLHAQGKTAEAMAEYRRVLKADPELAEAHSSLGVALAETGQYSGAVREFQEALRLRPGDLESRRNLELAREFLKKGPQ